MSPDPLQFSGPLELRNRLLAAVLAGAEPETLLIRCDDRAAVLVVGPKAQLVVVTPGDDTLATFTPRLRALIDAQPMGTLYLVVVGGTEVDRPALDALAQASPDPASLGLYHLPTSGPGAGELDRIAGRKLAALQRVSKQIASTAPMTPEDLRAAIEGVHRSHTEAAQFASVLGARFPLISLVIGAICILVYGAGRFEPDGVFGRALGQIGSNFGPLVWSGQVWRPLSSAFLHGSDMHLLANMLSLYFLGTFLERVVGRWRFLLVYGLSALCGGLASAALGKAGSVGSSGAIWGVMLAGYGLALRPGRVLPPVMASRLRRALMLPLILNASISFSDGIDRYAHFGGGLAGFVLAYAGLLWPQGDAAVPIQPVAYAPPATSRALKAAAVVVGAAMFLSLSTAVGLTSWVLSQPR